MLASSAPQTSASHDQLPPGTGRRSATLGAQPSDRAAIMASRTAVTVSQIQPAASLPVRATMTGAASSRDGG